MRAHRLVALASLAVFAGCGDRAATGGGDTGGTVVIVAAGRGSTPMFPVYAQDEMGRLGSDNIFERLAEIGDSLNTLGDGGFQPRLARSWQWAADSASIAFSIDPRARWHDGQPVRAADVRYSLNVFKDPKVGSPNASLLGDVDSVSVRDSLTAVVWFKRRSPEQFYTFVHNVFIMPEHVLKDIPAAQLQTSPAVTSPIGSGRFRMGRMEPGVRTELVADTTHYRGRAKLDRVIISFVGDPATQIAQLLAGEADFMQIVPPAALGRIDSAATTKLVPYNGLQYVYYGMNTRDRRNANAPHPILGDVRVRRAISMALDRSAMLQNVFGGRGRPSNGPFPTPYADPEIRIPAFDRAHAAALLDSAGWRAGPDGTRAKSGRPLTISLSVPSSSAARMAYAVLIQEQLKSVGVKVNIDQSDFGAFFNSVLAGNFDTALHGLAADPSKADLRQTWTTAGVPPNGQNLVRYSHPMVNAIADSLVATSDAARSKELLRRAHQQIADDAPAVWLYDVLTIAGAHNRVRTERMRPDTWWAGLSEWWIPANERIDRDRIGLRPPATP